MPQPGFFDLDDRYEKLSQSGDPLVQLNEIIPWGEFRPLLRKALHKAKKSNAGRKPFDSILMFKILVLQSLYNLSDAQTEYQIRDRFSFLRFLSLKVEDKIPDEKTIWLFREQLKESKALEKLFNAFDKHLVKQGFAARTGMMVDASIVEVPKQRNSREDNQKIKEGKTPEEWKENPNQLRQKDVEARWTRKNNQNYYGYKNHVNVDVQHKIIRKFTVTPASQGDITCLSQLLDENNLDKKIWGDKAYRSDAAEGMLKEKGYESRIHYRARVGNWISEEHKRWNHRYSKIRARVEHVFGFICNSMKGHYIRGIGLARASFRIGMNNLVYNFCRYKQCLQARSA
jgi:transposase, IS5 family